MAGPRIYGRVALAEIGPLTGHDAITRVLARPAPPVERRAIADTAGTLAEQLAPLPRALHDVATRVRRHCAAQRGQAKDEELAALLDALDTRASELWWALARLAP